MLLFHTTIKLEIAFTKVSTVEIVRAKPKIIIIIDNIYDCSLSSNEKYPRSGLTFGSTEIATMPEKPIKNTMGTIIKKDNIKLFLRIL